MTTLVRHFSYEDALSTATNSTRSDSAENVQASIRELLLKDQACAKFHSASIEYLGKPVTREQIFVIAPENVRCQFPSHLHGCFTGSRLRRLKRLAKSLSTEEIVHEILPSADHPGECIHRVTMNVVK